ncbi:MAG: DUF4383 domain-containing protein [Solirubrobacterales bacterium]|nr:DUF4383 domain-containing protein [Solirubrobacterales bacterium]MBV9713910.1 DUF4383 domain-containing protein [Solirubrobacterales bacterium]
MLRRVRDDIFGVFAVNGWHNAVHLASGIVGLLAARCAARTYALAFGAVNIVVAIWGFIIGGGDSIASILPINTADNVLHAAIGLAGVAAGLATRPAATSVPSRRREGTAVAG